MQLMAVAVPSNRAGVLSAVEAFIPTIPPNKPGGNNHVLSRPVQDFRRRRWGTGLGRLQPSSQMRRTLLVLRAAIRGSMINVWISDNAKIRFTG